MTIDEAFDPSKEHTGKSNDKPAETMEAFFNRVFGDTDHPDTTDIEADELHASIARYILKGQAGDLAKEDCFESIRVSPESEEPWTLTIAFRAGTISHEGQLTLQKMKHNAHRSKITVAHDDITAITFYVYSFSK